MPRPNQPRSIAGEASLARRIGAERERAGMSYEGLAARMDKIGCPINASGIYKIEKSGRRITVDELVGFSRVFEIAIDDLLLPPEAVVTAELRRLVKAYDRACEEARRAAEAETDALVALMTYASEHPDTNTDLLDLVTRSSEAMRADREGMESPALRVARVMANVTHSKEWRERYMEELRRVAEGHDWAKLDG